MIRTFLLLLAGTAVSLAASRLWRSADGTKSFRGELVKTAADTATIRTTEGKEFTVPLAKLHTDDRAWITNRKPTRPAGILGGLSFGESREKTAARLRKAGVIVSDATATKAHENMFGTSEVIGHCRTGASFGGQPAAVEFFWEAGDSLEGINIRTKPHREDAYDTELRQTWKEFAAWLIALHGESATTSSFPKPEEVPTGSLITVQTWQPPGGGAILLGLTRTHDGMFQAAAIFTRKAPSPP